MIFFLTGPDTYRARQKLRELKDKFVREVDATGLNISTIDGATLDVNDLAHVFDTMPLLSRRRFLIIENLFAAAKAPILEAVRTRLSSDDPNNIVVFFETAPPTKKSKLLDWLTQHSHAQQFALLEGAALSRWITTELKERDRVIDPPALRRLLQLAGNDLWRLHGELEKLDHALPAGIPINEVTVNELVSPTFDEDVFGLTDAVTGGNLGRAAAMLVDHLEEGVSPQQLVALLEKQFRVLVLLAAHEGNTPPTLPGIHPFIVKKLWATARRSSLPRLKKIYADLGEVDIDLKTSAGDPKTILLQWLVYSKASSSVTSPEQRYSSS